MSNYQITSNIGMGGQGAVYAATLLSSSKNVAMKLVDVTSQQKKHCFENEIDIISFLKPWKHRYLCNVFDYAEINGIGYIVMEKYDCDLFSYCFERNLKLSEQSIAKIFKKICLGLKTMHDKNIAHLDIKPENIMYDIGKNTPYLGDFGSAYKFDKSSMKRLGRRGTNGYYAKEIISGKICCPLKVDIFSLGVTLHVLLTGQYPFALYDKYRTINISEDISIECHTLLKLMLSDNPMDRPSINKVLSHPWTSPNNSNLGLLSIAKSHLRMKIKESQKISPRLLSKRKPCYKSLP